ncbi:MAG: L,D-transpeptidase family protein [Pseudomonadota bacterium]
MRHIRLFLVTIFLYGASNLQAAGPDFLPGPLVSLDDYFGHHVIVAEKSTHLLHLFTNQDGHPTLIKSYQMVTGKMSGNKVLQGDHRTPEGIYYFTEFIPRDKLLQRFGKEGEIYGIGAFVLNYPNPIDQRVGKSGGGIWIHSTNDETRIDKGLDSRGCVVISNNDLKDLSTYIELNKTMVVIVQDLFYIKKDTWEENRKGLQTVIDNWGKAWAGKDINNYILHYSKEEFKDSVRGNYEQFRRYKLNVFSAAGNPEIHLDNVSLVQFGNYGVATFKQHYKFQTINDTGKKILYLKRDEYYQWKIVSEIWSKLDLEERQQVAFRPSMRFFDNSPAKGNN